MYFDKTQDDMKSLLIWRNKVNKNWMLQFLGKKIGDYGAYSQLMRLLHRFAPHNDNFIILLYYGMNLNTFGDFSTNHIVPGFAIIF